MPYEQTEGPPVIQLDYSFLKSSLVGDIIAVILLAMWKGPSLGFACMVTKKGRGDRHAILALTRWFRENGLNAQIRIRTDSEAVIRALAAEVRSCSEVTGGDDVGVNIGRILEFAGSGRALQPDVVRSGTNLAA